MDPTGALTSPTQNPNPNPSNFLSISQDVNNLFESNSLAWSLPPDLTTKIFSMLDAKSLMKAGACCTKFNESSMDPLCYSHIDLPTAFEHEDNRALSTLIRRAGPRLRSLKLGHITKYNPSVLKSFCLAPLSSNQLNGNLLRTLHIYNPGKMSTEAVSNALQAFSNLTDLKIVGLRGSVQLVLDAITKNCHLIEHLFLKYLPGDGITDAKMRAFALNCPNLSFLTLIGCMLNDAMARSVFTCFTNLKYLELSDTFGSINGSFLRDLGSCCKDSSLETLVLQNNTLRETEVLLFLKSLITGDLRSIRYMDVSSIHGVVTDGDRRTSEPNFPLEELKKERPGLKFVAEIPSNPNWNKYPSRSNIL